MSTSLNPRPSWPRTVTKLSAGKAHEPPKGGDLVVSVPVCLDNVLN
jgi:hypothetical protein